jgi:hypothetical protein
MRALRRLLLAGISLLLVITPAVASDAFQKSVAVAESFVPIGLLLAQGTDTPLEIAAFGGAVLLQTVPNVAMFMAERAGRADLTRALRWTNFGIDCALGAGALGVGVALLAGAFGSEADLRMLGGLYLSLAVPIGVAAFADSVPYDLEATRSPAPAAASEAP